MTDTVSFKQAADEHAVLLPLLQSALPTIVSCTIVSTIIQANAQGCRVAALLHHHDDNDESAQHHHLFVKRIVASDYVETKKSWNDFRRTLLYGRTEVRFYTEVLPLLLKNRFPVTMTPKCHVAECHLEGLVDDAAVAWQNDAATTKMPTLQETIDKSSILVLDSIDMEQYYQHSPLSTSEAIQCLESVAHLHAAAWEHVDLLQTAKQRMARGSYHLSTRNPKELEEISTSWNHFVKEFQHFDPTLFEQPSIQALGRRMQYMADYISQELTPRPNEKFATLTHGDFKAMNVFLPKDTNNNNAIMIDFASTGVGLGMSDVAMHVIHAVLPTSENDDQHEMSCVQAYLTALQQARCKYESDTTPYLPEVAKRHYRLACVDYIRFIMGRFWKTATPTTFEARQKSMNTTLVNRNVDAALYWIRKVDIYLYEFEQERAAAAKN